MTESFVYCWTNHTNKKLYVGYHKGSVDDGYICSSQSQSFWNDFNNPKMKWSRQIIAHGTAKECIGLEKVILKSLDLNEHYNNAVGQSVVFTDEVRQKMSESSRGSKNYNYGKSFSEETKKKMSESRLGKVDSEETKLKKSLAKLGVARSKETIQKISFAKKGIKQNKVVCPRCKKEGGVSNMRRYHFENCRDKKQ